MRTVYVIGYPGAGKSTAVKGALTALGVDAGVRHSKPFAHVRFNDLLVGRVWCLGKQDGLFPGTDTLGMAVNPKAIEFVLAADADVMIGEGDRLANRKFLSACPELTVVLIDVPVDVAESRAVARAEAAGRPRQNESWWRGRCTKVDNLWGWALSEGAAVSIDGTAAPSQVASLLSTVVMSPVDCVSP